MGRREAMGALSAAGATLVLGCGDSAASASPATPTASPTGGNSTCAVTPTETVGPFPSLTDLFRSDIREGKPGTALTLTLRVVNASNGCTPVAGANVEIWHVDAAGDYSQYGAQRGQAFLRGIQTSDANGTVTFTTIYPGWYPGRATHIHVEVTVNGRSAKATQIAFPESVNAAVHGTGAYASRGQNPLSNAADGIFADSLSLLTTAPVGSPGSGFAASFQIGVAL